ALQMAHSLYLPKLEELVDKKEAKLDLFGAKKQKELLKKLDFLNLFADKEEAKLEKKEDEWEKFKQWWEEKKDKELAFFEGKKEKELAFFEGKKEGKLAKKTGKKSKPKKTTVRPCYSYQDKYADEEEEYVTTEAYEEEYESEEVTEKSCRKCYEKPTYSYNLRDDDGDEGDVRYFT
ncbi:hypothetical protein KR038_003436, partial [Drosophila bunnanda]